MDATRMKNALWGAFIADSIAMPVHWYYQRKYIKYGFDGGIILGMLAGAASEEISNKLKMGLLEYESIHQEIEDFIQVIKSN